MRSFAIHIYNNAADHKAKVDKLCEHHGVKIGPLFESIVENMPDADWEKYANLAKTKKGVSKDLRNKLSKSLGKLDEKGIEAVMATLREQGVAIDNE
jgi:hypothetical protein